MAQTFHLQNIIAMVWDFDCTLTPAYSQEPLFEEYKVDPGTFWAEVNALRDRYLERGLMVGIDTAYLMHILTYVQHGRFEGLTNSRLRDLGSRIKMCPGIPEFFTEIADLVAADPRYSSPDNSITLEHYVVSTGVRPLIEGSSIGGIVKAIWANEFVDQLPPPDFLRDGYAFEAEGVIEQVGYMIDNTSKTRAIFEINKGDEVDVNARMSAAERRVPFNNMIYVADGPSDVPVFSLLFKEGGRCLGVHQPGHRESYLAVKRLQDEGRVHHIAPADYQPGTPAHMWLSETVREIATRICDDRESLGAGIKAPPGHILAPPPAS